MRLIDADALKDGYMNMGYDPNEHPEESYMEGWCKGFNAAVDHCIGHVIYAPTIEERKTGKWIDRWAQNGEQVREVRECSECGAFYLRYYDTADGFDCVPPRYCPNCGAKMEEGE